MTGCRTPLPLACLPIEAVDVDHALSTVTVCAHVQRTLFSASASSRQRAPFLLRNASVAEVRPPIPSYNTPLAIPRSR